MISIHRLCRARHGNARLRVPSSYPGKCTVTVEFRTVPAQTKQSILGDISALLKEIAEQKSGFKYSEPRITMSRPTQTVDANHPVTVHFPG
jgi:acetylornithine deacetylase/succinyl-diaminopimelate desuccinylase-like protein